MPTVELLGRRAPRQRFERQDVRLRQIVHVDVVADAGAVGRRVIVAEDRRRLARFARRGAAAESGASPARALRPAAFRIGARGVEVAQAHAAQTVWIASNQRSIFSTITFDSPYGFTG